jgi:tRNA(Ile)-lysidine synthetase-like protein
LDAVEIAIRGQHSAISLFGGGFRLRVEYDLLWIETEDSPEVVPHVPLLSIGFELQIDIPSSNSVTGWTLHSTLEQPSVDSPFCRLAIPNNTQVVLRTRRDGDKFVPLGMKGHTQKLSRWMVNRKIPQNLRDQIPLLVVENEVAAICLNGQWIISESFAVRNTPEGIIYFQFLENS